jgi:hypothetical protein
MWLPEKLSVAVQHIAIESSLGQLYVQGGITTYKGENLKPIGLSTHFVFPKTFMNALIQIIAGGNNMVSIKPLKVFWKKWVRFLRHPMTIGSINL